MSTYEYIKLYPVDGRVRGHRLSGECFGKVCQAARIQAGGGSIHIWGCLSVIPNHILPYGIRYKDIQTFRLHCRHFLGNVWSLMFVIKKTRLRIIMTGWESLPFSSNRASLRCSSRDVAKVEPHRSHLGGIGEGEMKKDGQIWQNLGELRQAPLDKCTKFLAENL